ncbi:hypothetical protein NDU88_004165 [Pleurodeles waltl]|uniref:Uncharacterized protein n=1 Tax=Pleurodeles waltl TaxID=8319 RepID=A0AAV7T7C3_PLEWA|nr:hypothetical protein NDU88_004165 [Pleurodeles waltl]
MCGVRPSAIEPGPVGLRRARRGAWGFAPAAPAAFSFGSAALRPCDCWCPGGLQRRGQAGRTEYFSGRTEAREAGAGPRGRSAILDIDRSRGHTQEKHREGAPLPRTEDSLLWQFRRTQGTPRRSKWNEVRRAPVGGGCKN